MNPNDASQNQNVNTNLNTTTPAVNSVQPQSTVQNTAPSVSAPVQIATPVAPVTPTPAPVVQTPVTPAPSVQPQAQNVTPSVQENTIQEVTITPIAAQVVTPVPVTPQVAPQDSVPSVTPIPTETQNVTPTPMPTDPNADIKQINLSKTQPETQDVPPSASNAEPTVITTTRSKGSNIVLAIVIIILIAFAFNIDTILKYYENYMETGSLTKTDVPTDNLTGGYILINESTSSIKVKNIKFHNFKKVSPMTVSFNYETADSYSNPSELGIYIELYNSDKNVVYKELFNPENGIEKNTTVNYSMELESDVFEKAYYALVKTYTEEELNATSSLVCKKENSNYKYENKYSFTNNELNNYEVQIVSISEDKTEIEEEYNKVKDKLSATYDNNTLKYNVDLNTEISDFNPDFKKGITPEIVKSRNELKEWTCE